MTFFLKVSDTDFSLYANYEILFFWEDDRIFVNDPNPLPHYILDTNLLDKFWSPQDKVFISHAKESRQNAGLLHHKTGFAMVKQDGRWTFEVSVSTKPEITCPMDFSWFPFDLQVGVLDILKSRIDYQYINTFLRYRYQ